MRLCFVSTGAFAHVGHYLEHFQAEGHDVRFIALSPSPARPVPTYDLSLPGRYSSTEGKWKYSVSVLRARALIRALEPDLVHAHFATSGGLAALVSGFHPCVVTAHGSDLAAGIRSPLRRGLLRAVFGSADCVNTVSEPLKALALELGVPEDKVLALSPGIDAARFALPRRPGPRGVLRLVSTRRLDPECDPLTIVAALRELARRGVEFSMIFAGDGRLRARARIFASQLGLADRVSFLGPVPQSELPALLARRDVYLSASLWDGTSLSLLEAMAAGLLPVVSRIPANEAWLEDGRTALFHKPGDVRGLAEALEAVSRRPELAASAAPLNRARVLTHGERRSNMSRLEDQYVELLRRGRLR
jgi:L-malate glycosyltransferase